jgi:nitrite reductase/ring-hydroxylating ferredoxin subunit
MDMAKVQKHTADPSKITGRCGKLLCCLRYEYSAYTEARELLPARGTRVETRRGTGVVVDQNLLLREVAVEITAGERTIVKLEEILDAPKSVAGCSGCATPAVGAAPAPETAKMESDVRRKIEQDTKTDMTPPAEHVWVRAAKVAEFLPGGAKVLDLEGIALAVFNVGGQIHVLPNECPHQGGPLGQGKLEGATVTCPLHQWQFDVTTGKGLSVSGAQLRRYETRIEGEDLFIRI